MANRLISIDTEDPVGEQFPEAVRDEIAALVPVADVASAIHAASAKTALVDADEIGVVDSAAGNTLKKATIAAVRNAVGPQYDARYFGVKTDGTTDDSDAWDTALAAVWAAGGGNLVLPGSATASMVSRPINLRPVSTHSGTAQAGAAGSITLAVGASGTNTDYYFGLVKITSGTGNGQTRVITAYNGTTKVATVGTNFSPAPDSTSVYTVQFWPTTLRSISLIGQNPFASGIKALAGFADSSFDGKEAVVRCEGVINERYGSVRNLRIDGNSQADYGLLVGAVVEREFASLLLQGGVVSGLAVDGAQNNRFQSLHVSGGTYPVKVLNGTGSNHFDRVEVILGTTANILFDKDTSFRMSTVIPGLNIPFWNKFTKGLSEAPPTGPPIMAQIYAGFENIFDTYTFSSTRPSGSQSVATVQLGDGTGDNLISGNKFNECQFNRNGDTAAGDYVVVEDDAFNSTFEHCVWTGGYSSESAAIRASGDVKIHSPELLDNPKAFIDAVNGATGTLIQVLQNHIISGTTSQRPNYGATPHGVRPPYYNTTTSTWETMIAGTWADLASGGGGTGVVETIVPSTGIDVDSTDPANPVVSIESSVYRAGGTDVALADGGTGRSLADPNADRLMFWDDSAAHMDWLTLGTNLSITGTTLDAAGGTALADGDYGDVSVSDGGTVLTVESANNLVDGFNSITSSAGTTTLNVNSARVQAVTGTSTQTIKLPTSSVPAGHRHQVINLSTGAVTVQSSAANTLVVLPSGSSATFIAKQATPTTAAHWLYASDLIANPTLLNYGETQYDAGTKTTTWTVDIANGNVQRARGTASTTCAVTLPTPGNKPLRLFLEQAAATGAALFTFAGVDWGAASTYSTTATIGKYDIVDLIPNSVAAKWCGTYAQGFTY